MQDLVTAVVRRWRLVSAAVVVVAAVGAVAVVSGTDGDDSVVAVGSTTTAGRTEVLDDVVERPESIVAEDSTTSTTGVDVGTTEEPTTTVAGPSTTGTSTTGATTTSSSAAPTTTTCWNATDPACGPLHWEPTPTDHAPTVVSTEAPATARVGEPVHLSLVLDDPDGGAGDGTCEDWASSDPGVVATGSCVDVPEDCPRFGPHDPPAPTPARTTHETTVRFTEPGEQTVTVSAFTPDTLLDGCPNPYSSVWSHTFRVTVTEDVTGTTGVQVEQQD